MLWYNTNEAKSMPKWYARQCFTSGDVCVSEDGHLDLSTANTQFATGDCVILFSDSPIGGLANEGVYYLRREPSDPSHYHYSVFASREEAEGEGEGITLTAGSGSQLFVKYDPKETTKDGTEGFAMVLVDSKTAMEKIDGFVSCGWWRYTKYTTSTGVAKTHRELLVSFRAERIEEGEGDQSFNGGGTVDDEGRTTPSVTLTKIGDWTVNAPAMFNVEIVGNDFAAGEMTLAISGLDNAERVEQNVDSEWVAVEPQSITVSEGKHQFRAYFPYSEGGAEAIVLSVELSGEGFEGVDVGGEVPIVNEPNASTVEYATADNAIVA